MGKNVSVIVSNVDSCTDRLTCINGINNTTLKDCYQCQIVKFSSGGECES